jgi:hypothetical protein
MIPLLLTAIGAYLIGDSQRASQTFADGGEVKLLAPNGKPSNLTPEQYKLVRTPEFKAWFGDWENDAANASKVLDESGEPKVMWHGSDRMEEIHIFNSNKGFLYNFFSEDKGECGRYVIDYDRLFPNDRYNSAARKKYYDSKIKPFFIKARKIFEFEKLTDSEMNWIDLFIDNNESVLFSACYKYITDSGSSFNGWKIDNDVDENIENKDLILFFLKSSDDWVVLETPVFQDELNIKGYDSFVTKESGAWNIAAYDPANIKFADGTNTTFDSSNPDIRFAKGGTTDIWYHGSKRKFYTFELFDNKTYKEIDLPVWFFTKDVDYAKTYGKFLYKVKLNIDNTFDTSNEKHFSMFIDYLKSYDKKNKEIDEILDEQFFRELPYWTCDDAYYCAISNGFDSILIAEDLERDIESIGVFNKDNIQIL